MEDLELLRIWMDRYIDFISCPDQIKYTNILGMQDISNFQQFKQRFKNQ